MKTNNNLIKMQEMLMRQMERLDNAISSEISIEVARSGALSQNAQAYLKSINTSLRVKDMVKKNPLGEKTVLEEIGVLNEEYLDEE